MVLTPRYKPRPAKASQRRGTSFSMVKSNGDDVMRAMRIPPPVVRGTRASDVEQDSTLLLVEAATTASKTGS